MDDNAVELTLDDDLEKSASAPEKRLNFKKKLKRHGWSVLQVKKSTMEGLKVPKKT